MRERARSDEEKGERRRAILAAALTLWAESDYEALTMDAVAERTGLAKGTLYRYFATKEELLIELVEQLLVEWLDDVDRRLGASPEPLDAEQLGRLLSLSLRHRESLLRLLTLVGGILEHNIGDARALQFKRLLQTRMARTAAGLARRMPSLGNAGAARFLLHAYALLTGLGQMAYPAPVIGRVLEAPGFDMFRIEVTREFGAAATALLRGHEGRGRRKELVEGSD